MAVPSPEGWLNNVSTHQPDWVFLSASVPRAALRSALGYLLLPLWGGRIGSRPEARGQRREGTAKQPENFGAILRRYPRITQIAGTVPGYFLRCALVSIPRSQGDPAEVSLSVLETGPDLGRTDRPVRTILCSRRASVPRGGASLCPGLSPFAPVGRTDREQARGEREQPNSRKTLARSSAGIQGSRCMSLSLARVQ